MVWRFKALGFWDLGFGVNYGLLHSALEIQTDHRKLKLGTLQ